MVAYLILVRPMARRSKPKIVAAILIALTVLAAIPMIHSISFDRYSVSGSFSGLSGEQGFHRGSGMIVGNVVVSSYELQLGPFVWNMSWSHPFVKDLTRR